MKKLLFFVLLTMCLQTKVFAEVRFNYYGDGTLNIAGKKINFRDKNNQYIPSGLNQIYQAFGAPSEPAHERLSLRLIEMLDYSQEKFASNQALYIKSGYRSPGLNNKLRAQGKLAAQSSMHIEGAAVDAYFQGKNSGELFEQIKALNCCGIGYYGSLHFHLDVGPARYWNQSSSKTEDKTPQLNEKIMVESDFDLYPENGTINLQLMRVTNYPVDIAMLAKLVKSNGKSAQEVKLNFIEKNGDDNPSCVLLDNRSAARKIQLQIPKDTKSGIYQIELSLCNKRNYDKMPDKILTRAIRIN